MPSIEEFLDDAKRRMDKSIETTRTEFNSVRTGRASAALLDRITIELLANPPGQLDGQTLRRDVTHSHEPRERRVVLAPGLHRGACKLRELRRRVGVVEVCAAVHDVHRGMLVQLGRACGSVAARELTQDVVHLRCRERRRCVR